MLQDFTDGLSLERLIVLYKECAKFSRIGTLPHNAQLRHALRDQNISDTAINLTLASTYVYRALATRYVRDCEIATYDKERY